MTKPKFAFFVLSASLTFQALAYDVRTHTAVTARATEAASTQVESQLLQRLGISRIVSPLGNYYVDMGLPLVVDLANANRTLRAAQDAEREIMKEVRDRNAAGTIPSEFSITGWIMRGGIREDDNPTDPLGASADEPGGMFHREFGHFFDPQNNQGLTVGGVNLGPTAPNWGIDRTVAVPLTSVVTRRGFNHFGVTQAREAQWRALTLKRIAPDGSLTPEPSLTGTVNGASVTIDGEQLRKAYWASMFRAVGDISHLVQDMAQPQHTRNDPHSGYGCAFGSCGGGHDSFYEKYIAARTIGVARFNIKEGPLGGSGNGVPHVSNAEVLSFLPPYQVAFNSYADFFSTGTGTANDASAKGLANYSNRGFYSTGTNIGNTTFPSPSPTGLGLGNSSVGGAGNPTALDITGIPLPAGIKIDFRTGSVNDAIGGASAADVKLTTTGFWDEFLTLQGDSPRYSLNYYNYDEQAKFLIPRAVAYSAGLIDYFFRGQLEIALPNEGVYAILDHSVPGDNCKDTCGFRKIKLKVANATPDITPSGGGSVAPQAMTGGTLVAVAKYHKNNCYTTDLEGEYDSSNLINAATETLVGYMQRCRGTAEEIAVSQPLTNQTVTSCSTTVASNDPNNCNNKFTAINDLTFNFTTPIPINATDLYLQVVYRGPLGSEQDAVVVATKDIPEPTYFSIVNITDYLVCYNNAWYYKSASGALPPPPTIPETLPLGGLAADFYQANTYSFWRVTFQPATGIPIAQTDNLLPKEFARFAILTESGRTYNDEISGYYSPSPPPFALTSGARHQINYAADGSSSPNLTNWLTSNTRKVKANVPAAGYKYNLDGAGACIGVPPPADPAYPPYTKPTVMKPVTITF